jgi:hypothetical protein
MSTHFVPPLMVFLTLSKKKIVEKIVDRNFGDRKIYGN